MYTMYAALAQPVPTPPVPVVGNWDRATAEGLEAFKAFEERTIQFVDDIAAEGRSDPIADWVGASRGIFTSL